ncbi:MAG: hypothetical protein AB4372_17065 [Xenococcus sp. (in: cyanobacteria)]
MSIIPIYSEKEQQQLKQTSIDIHSIAEDKSELKRQTGKPRALSLIELEQVHGGWWPQGNGFGNPPW